MSDGDFQKGATQEHYEGKDRRPAFNWIKLETQPPPVGKVVLIRTKSMGFYVGCRETDQIPKGFDAWCMVLDEQGNSVDFPTFKYNEGIGHANEWAHYGDIKNEKAE